MSDIFSKEKRSLVMSAVKSRGSKVEAQMASILRRRKIRYRSHPRKYAGKPDFYLPDFSAFIFVDSCFWHGCRYHGTIPKSNLSFWKKKLALNKNRDRAVNRQYKKMGWVVIRIWEHSITKSGDKVERLLKALK
mgnify:CR=1 FL=1